MQFLIILFASLLSVPGAVGHTGKITGTIICSEKVMLPPNAIIVVKLIDASLADAPSKTLSSKKIKPQGRQFPIPFSLKYDKGVIRDNMDYRVQVSIKVNGKLRFLNTSAHSVLTRGNSDKVEVVVDPIKDYPGTGSTGHSRSLENTDWKLIEIAGKPINSQNDKGCPFIHLDSKEKRLSGSGGCNRLIGGYKLDAQTLDFGSVGSTRMFCQETMDLEGKFIKVLDDTDKYRIVNDVLELYAGNKLLARLKANNK